MNQRKKKRNKARQTTARHSDNKRVQQVSTLFYVGVEEQAIKFKTLAFLQHLY